MQLEDISGDIDDVESCNLNRSEILHNSGSRNAFSLLDLERGRCSSLCRQCEFHALDIHFSRHWRVFFDQAQAKSLLMWNRHDKHRTGHDVL